MQKAARSDPNSDYAAPQGAKEQTTWRSVI